MPQDEHRVKPPPGSGAFPFFNAHADARCYRCGDPLHSHQDFTNDFPAGRGRYRGHCLRCDATTWYDCGEALT